MSGFAILAAMAFLATRTEAQPGQVKLIVPGVWFREGDLANLGHCNNIIIEMQDYLIVVDANSPSGALLTLEIGQWSLQLHRRRQCGNWPKVIHGAQTLTTLYVLPGHGPSAGPEILEGQAKFMTELHKAVGAAIKQGKKFEDVVPPGATTVHGNVVPATTTITLPASVSNWVGPGLPSQVRDTWDEIVQKKPHGDIPH